MKRIVAFFSVLLLVLYACEPDAEDQKNKEIIKDGTWRGVLKPQNIQIPFVFQVYKNGGKYSFELVNAEERIPLSEVSIKADSIHVPLYIFDATLHAKIEEGKYMHGIWVKNYLEDYTVPFEASFGDESRFSIKNENASFSFDGKWEVDFITDGGIDKAIGLFEQSGNKLAGTFLTPTGDYRFLEGVVDGSEMKLSCFDGTHAYLFTASGSSDGSIEGDFWSGKTWHQKWVARRNSDFELTDPSSMTYLKNGYETFDIKFPNPDGEVVQLSDERFEAKVVVIQIMGTWCPNCMDETKLLAKWYRKNKERGVAILGLAFERKADVAYAASRIKKMKKMLDVDYQILIAGTNSQESRKQALPMINKILAFPTTIFLDKQHKVRKIHTGFSGPGTGLYYDRFVEEFNLFMDKLIAE